jgi:hypothetical protein
MNQSPRLHDQSHERHSSPPAVRFEDQEASSSHAEAAQSPEQKAEEAHRILRLQRLIGMVEHVIQRDRTLPVERASALVADARRAALAMFPDKAQAFDMLMWPRLQRTMRTRYRMQ